MHQKRKNDAECSKINCNCHRKIEHNYLHWFYVSKTWILRYHSLRHQFETQVRVAHWRNFQFKYFNCVSFDLCNKLNKWVLRRTKLSPRIFLQTKIRLYTTHPYVPEGYSLIFRVIKSKISQINRNGTTIRHWSQIIDQTSLSLSSLWWRVNDAFLGKKINTIDHCPIECVSTFHYSSLAPIIDSRTHLQNHITSRPQTNLLHAVQHIFT
jgi:hypothetical protein